MTGWCRAEGWLKICEGQCQWVRQTIAGAGLRDNKGKQRADWKVDPCHLPPVEKINQIQSSNFINWREGQLIKKITHTQTQRTQQTPTHTCTHTPFLPRLSQMTKILLWGFMSGWQKREIACSCDSTRPLSLENDPYTYVGCICRPHSWVLQKNVITELYQQNSMKPNNMTSHLALCPFDPWEQLATMNECSYKQEFFEVRLHRKRSEYFLSELFLNQVF